MKKLKRIAKRLLAIGAIRKTVNGVTRVFLWFGGSSRLGATLYSFLGWFTHNREQYAVLAGRRAYYRNLGKQRRTHVELRRNIHRLEKGATMRPRRTAYAKDYIAETIEFYERAIDRPDGAAELDAGETQWSFDVLSHYFTLVDTNEPVIAKAAQRFAELPAPGKPGPIHPYAAKKLTPTDITYDQMLSLAENRRSVRWFQDKPVPRELVDQALAVGRQAPTACNRMPYEFLVFDDPAEVPEIAGIPFGSASFAHQVPMVIVAKGDLSSYPSPRDRHLPYIDTSLAIMGFVYALETLGLNSCLINWPDFEPLEAKMSKRLGLKPHERVIMLIAVGYSDPTGEVPYSRKKDHDTIRRFDPLDS